MDEVTLLISAVLGPAVAVVGYAWTRKGKREEAEIERDRLGVEGLSAAVGALKETVAVLESRVTRLEEEKDVLHRDLQNEREYVQVLITHIEKKLPPPPPSRAALLGGI